MTSIRALAVLLAVFAPAVTSAQFVKGNEAVTTASDGVKRVITPPLPATGSARSSRPCPATDGCHVGAWLMVETDGGLMECTEPYGREGTCRQSTYGKTKLLRLWLVRRGGTWLQCQLPDIDSRCVDMASRPPTNLPYPAVQ